MLDQVMLKVFANRRKEGRRRFWAPLGLLLIAAVGLSGCSDAFELAEEEARHDVPLKGRALSALKDDKLKASDPVLIRIFKQERKLEVWKHSSETDRFVFLTDYDICAYSGDLGPKLKQGDRQSPEGFYSVSRAQMNPKSQYHLSFNLGYPNLFERSNRRTGSALMVHGDCVSAGCYAMTDKYIEEIYALVREAHAGGQRHIQVQAFPFRMTEANMSRHRDSENYVFWQILKEGYDAFEQTRQEVKVDVCDRRYVFNKKPAKDGDLIKASKSCPPLVSTRKETVASLSLPPSGASEVKPVISAVPEESFPERYQF